MSQKEEVNVKEVAYYFAEDKLRMLAGRVLTIIDASISDKNQNKALKDLIKQSFWKVIESFQVEYLNGGHSVHLESKDSDPMFV